MFETAAGNPELPEPDENILILSAEPLRRSARFTHADIDGIGSGHGHKALASAICRMGS